MRSLAEIAAFLELEGEIPAGGIDTRRSATYERRRTNLATTGPGAASSCGRLCRRYEPSANDFGYSLLDLARTDPFPVGSPAPPDFAPAVGSTGTS